MFVSEGMHPPTPTESKTMNVTTLKTFAISNPRSGAILGKYEGVDANAARIAMVIDAGYDLGHVDHAEQVEDAAGLTVVAAVSDDAAITAKVTGRGETSSVPDNASAVDADIFADGVEIGSVTLLPDLHGLATWGNLDNWADHRLVALVEADEDGDLCDRITAAVTSAAL